ncbi:hypothetical protein L9F63_003048, partial [Diploptera punctata]
SAAIQWSKELEPGLQWRTHHNSKHSSTYATDPNGHKEQEFHELNIIEMK